MVNFSALAFCTCGLLIWQRMLSRTKNTIDGMRRSSGLRILSHCAPVSDLSAALLAG